MQYKATVPKQKPSNMWARQNKAKKNEKNKGWKTDSNNYHSI